MAKKSNQPPASGAKAPSGKVKERDARTQAKIEALGDTPQGKPTKGAKALAALKLRLNKTQLCSWLILVLRVFPKSCRLLNKHIKRLLLPALLPV
jgi:hypothetical protein